VNRGVMMRIAACGLLGLGSALIIAALLLSTYTSNRLAKIPLDWDATLVSEGKGRALDPVSLSGQKFIADPDKPVMLQEQITTVSPADATKVGLQAGITIRRTDKQGDAGLVLATVDTVTVDRHSAEAISSDDNPGGSVQKPRAIEDETPPTTIALKHEGLSYRFPFDTEKKTYQYFDVVAQRAFDANYTGEEDVNGLTAYHFTQNVGYDANGKLVEPVAYPSLYDKDEDSKVTARAQQWGVEAEHEDEEITMTRYYAAQREFWVDPVSGIIVKSKEHALHYYSRDALKPEVPMVDYTVQSNDETVEKQVKAARDTRDSLSIWSNILPITFAALGVVALVGGGLLGSFSLRADSALIDPGLDTVDHGFFGRRGPEKPPASEADTDKFPSPRNHL